MFGMERRPGAYAVEEILDLGKFYGVVHWPGRAWHGRWFVASAPIVRAPDGEDEIGTFVPTGFIDRRDDGVAAQVYAEPGTHDAVLSEHWERV